MGFGNNKNVMSCVYVGLFCLPSEGLVLLCDVSESVAADSGRPPLEMLRGLRAYEYRENYFSAALGNVFIASGFLK